MCRYIALGVFYLVLLMDLVDLMNLVGLCQVVDVGCPTVEKEYGKHSHS